VEGMNMSKIYTFYECQECPYYSKYPMVDEHPNFWCRNLKKVVEPLLIDPDCPLEDGE